MINVAQHQYGGGLVVDRPERGHHARNTCLQESRGQADDLIGDQVKFGEPGLAGREYRELLAGEVQVPVQQLAQGEPIAGGQAQRRVQRLVYIERPVTGQVQVGGAGQALRDRRPGGVFLG